MASNHSNSTKNEQTIMIQCLVSYIVESPSEAYINTTIGACIINVVFFVLGCTLNTLVVVTFSVSKQLRSKWTFFPIFVLCSVDLVTVLVVHPLFLLQAIAEILKTPTCSYKVAYFSALYIFPGMSGSTLLLMNIERYITIVRPLWQIRYDRKRLRFMLICVLLWLLMVANLACRLYKPPYSKAFTMVGISIACFIIVFIYASIFYVAKNRSSTFIEETNMTQETRRKKTSFLQDLKIAKMYFLVVILFFICFLPIGVVVFATKYPWKESEDRRTLLAQVYTWANTFMSINSTINCLVFFWANASLRKEAWKVCKGYHALPESSNLSGQQRQS